MLSLRRVLLSLLMFVVIGTALVSTSNSLAQTLSYTFTTPNPEAYANFGNALALADVNGDGRNDVIVGSPGETVGGNILAGRTYVFSGSDGALLYSRTDQVPQAYGYFGSAVAGGDVDGDGRSEFIVGAFGKTVAGHTNQGEVSVFSGATGTLLFTLTTLNPTLASESNFGRYVRAADVDGDGAADIIATAHNELVNDVQLGRIYVFSGATLAPLHTFIHPNPGFNSAFGQSVGAGDVNGDGKSDIIAGAFAESAGGNSDQGRVYVFSGATGGIIWNLDAPSAQAGEHFGGAVAVGDVDLDGKGDVIASAPYLAVGANAAQGRVYAFSGATGALLRDITTPNPGVGAYFGWSVAAGVVDGDGRAAIAVGAVGETVGGNEVQGRAYVFFGAANSQIATMSSPNPEPFASFGGVVALRDVNGDGSADAAVAAYDETAGAVRAGRVYISSELNSPLPPPACLRFGQKLRLIIGIRRLNGTHVGDRRYRALYDVNADGKIDELDLARVRATPVCRARHDDRPADRLGEDGSR